MNVFVKHEKCSMQIANGTKLPMPFCLFQSRSIFELVRLQSEWYTGDLNNRNSDIAIAQYKSPQDRLWFNVENMHTARAVINSERESKKPHLVRNSIRFCDLKCLSSCICISSGWCFVSAPKIVFTTISKIFQGFGLYRCLPQCECTRAHKTSKCSSKNHKNSVEQWQ